ncbi:MAG: hypothetical protein M3124_01630, partial [Actinomycetota bacterium]|nr:hypothetical protein [Actinomycetota bacterium]
IVAALSAVAVSLLPSPVAAANGELTRVAPACRGGSSDATFAGNNRRLAMSAGGRLLAVYDPHGSGVQLRWKDPGTEWSRETEGEVQDGQLLGLDIGNDRPASIVVDQTRTSAWVVWAGYNFELISEVRMRRLTNLDAPDGPTVGPEVTLRPGVMGNARVDAVYHGGGVYVSWTERTAATTYRLMAGRLSDHSETPSLTDEAVLWSGSDKDATGTLVPTSVGLRVAARTDELRIYSQVSEANWAEGSGTAELDPKARPSAVALDTGAILVAAQSEFGDRPSVKVFRFANDGNGTPEVEVQTGVGGYEQPTLVHVGGESALLVMVNDDTLVSRARTGGAWSSSDTIELTPQDSGNYEWPNALRDPSDGRLELLVSGARCPESGKQQEVLHLRRLPVPPPPPPVVEDRTAPVQRFSIEHAPRRDVFKGVVWAKEFGEAYVAPGCRNQRQVVVKRKRPGPDKVVDHGFTNRRGRYFVPNLLTRDRFHKGRFRAKVVEVVLMAEGRPTVVCESGLSKIIRVR